MTYKQQRTFWRFLLACATTFAIVMALIPHAPHVVEVGDKWQHMAAFGTLTLLSVFAYPEAHLYRIGERLSFLGALIEVFQSIPAIGRDCDVWDWVADTAIILLVLAVARLVRGRRASTL